MASIALPKRMLVGGGTVGRAALESAVQQAALTRVITSRAFLERVDPDVRAALESAELILLENVLQELASTY